LKSVLALTTERGSFSGSALGLGSGAFHDCGVWLGTGVPVLT